MNPFIDQSAQMPIYEFHEIFIPLDMNFQHQKYFFLFFYSSLFNYY